MVGFAGSGALEQAESAGATAALTTEARGWLEDCWTVLPDDRRTATLSPAEVWELVARLCGIPGFLSDSGIDTTPGGFL